MNFCEGLLRYAYNDSAISMMAGIVWSILCEQWPAFGNLSFGRKRAAMFLLCLVVPMVALYAGATVYHCEGMAWNRAGLIGTLAQGCVAFTFSQFGHLLVREQK